MNVNSQNVSSNSQPRIFNNPERFIEGWYWVIPSKNLRVGEVKSVTVLGKELAIYRGKDKRAVTVDAYCPHMGAHLAKGKVQGNELRCFSHHWTFDAQGFCVDIPCLHEPLPIKLKTWPTAEKYGLIWVWTGELPKQPIPFILELEHKDYDVAFGANFVTNYHPNSVMIHAIDVQRLNIGRKLSSEVIFEKQEVNPNAIIFNNTTRIGGNSFLFKLIRPFSKNITYNICYWYGSTGMVTIGPDFFHVHVIFAARLLEGGKSQVQMMLITKKRRGIFGGLCNRVVLQLTKMLGASFLKGEIQPQMIQFDVKTPIKADQPIMEFIDHLERQKSLMWGTWQLGRSQNGDIREPREKWRDTMSRDSMSND